MTGNIICEGPIKRKLEMENVCQGWNSAFILDKIKFISFKEAIASASSFAEVERLQAILQSGRIPESGWNLGRIGLTGHTEER